MAVKAAAVIDVNCKNLSKQSKSKGLPDGAPFKPVKQNLFEIVQKHGRLAINLVIALCLPFGRKRLTILKVEFGFEEFVLTRSLRFWRLRVGCSHGKRGCGRDGRRG